MRKLLALFVVLLSVNAFSQHKFIKTMNDAGYGRSLRVLPTQDQGWVIFSLDSLKLTKFNHCGDVEWSKKYTLPPCYYHTDFIKTPSNGFALLSLMINGNSYLTLVTTFDSAGNIIWSKSFNDQFYGQYPYTLTMDAQGNFIFYSNVSQTGGGTFYNMLCKIDVSGNILWTKFYDHGGIWGGSIATSDNGTLIRTGNIFIKTDQNGNVQWTSKFNITSAYYYKPIEVSDGYLFSVATSGPQNIGYYKMDLAGNILWGGGKISDYSGQPPTLIKKSNGHIVGVFNKTTAGITSPTLIEFDKDLNIVAQNSYLPGTSLLSKDLCFLVDGTPLITGFATGTLFPFHIKTTQTYQSDCDAAPATPVFTLNVATQNLIPTNVSPNTLGITNINATAASFALTQTNLCSTTKRLNIGQDTLICQGQTLLLKNRTTDVFDHYHWSTGDTTETINISLPGTYWLVAIDNCDPNSANDTVKITIKPSVVVDLGADVVKCEDARFTFHAADCSSCTYTWSTGSTMTAIEVVEKGTYWLKVDNNNGCQYADTVNVDNMKCECSLYIPNSFTPNSDGLNDGFKPVYYCDLQEYELKVFDRWGHLIFESHDIEDSWNGKNKNGLIEQGVYTYLVNYRPLIKGLPGNAVSKHGSVAVIY
jgi:gliding motility-associated-like protein